MLSRRVLTASRFLRAPRTPQLRHPFPLVAQQFRTYAEKIVQVPQMAESISEGTLKQWSKQIGDYVEQDEEIATIETDKVSSSSFAAPALPGKHSDNASCRSMSQSMHPKLVLSRSSSRMKRILLQLDKIWSEWSLEENLPQERRRREALSPRSQLLKSSQHLQIPSQRRRNQRRNQVLHLHRRRSQSQRRSHHPRRSPSPRLSRSQPVLHLLSETGKRDAYVYPYERIFGF